MDPVTGLSKRQQIAIGVLIPFAIAGSTIATIVDERGSDRCPDQAYECATIEPGEPVVIGIVDASKSSAESPFSDLRDQSSSSIHGHQVQLHLRRPGCSAEAAAQDVRELASDPPDEPPAVLVIAAACDEAAVPMAQLLSDSGVTLLTLVEVRPVPTSPAYHLVAPEIDLEGQAAGVQPIGIASHLRDLIVEHVAGILEDAVDAIERLAIVDGEQMLVPRTPLRDALIGEGYRSAG